MPDIKYTDASQLQSLALTHGLVLPNQQQTSNPSFPIIEDVDYTAQGQEQIDDEGALIAEKIRQFAPQGYRPTFEEAKKYREFMRAREISAFSGIADAVGQTASDLANAAVELAGDALTLKVPKVVGSVIEGAALGTKNWYYMYEEAKYNEESILHKMLFNKHNNDEDYYYDLIKLLDVRQRMEKDINEGILLPKEVEVGGVKFDLWNPAVVMGISYVADPSWVSPNLGIESTLAKGMRGASKVMALNEQLAHVGVWSAKQAEIGAAKAGQYSKAVANQIVKTEEALIKSLKDVFNVDAFISTTGNVVDKNDLGRAAMAGAGLNKIKIPAWGVTSLVWGTTKIVETAANAAELAAKLAQEPTIYDGLRLSERLAMKSDNKTVRALSGTWAKTGSPFIEWAANTTRTSLHSGMYGGAFGFVFGGEEGFYHGVGAGFVIGGSFHQIGALHNTVSGFDAPKEVMKNFLWATDSLDFNNKEGIFRLLENVERESGPEAKLRVMSEIAAAERLQRDVKRLYLTEEKIKQLVGEDSAEWDAYEKQMLSDPDFGGTTFHRSVNDQKVVIINADRAYKFAVKEELFHTLLLDGRYGLEFQRTAMDSLLGTQDAKGVLLQIPKEDAVRALEAFRDVYLGLESEGSDGNAMQLEKVRQKFNEAISDFKEGKNMESLNKLFEEFLASYWNAFNGDKPIDYLLSGGDLGLIRNAIQIAKDAYKTTMHQDLFTSGAKFKFGDTIEGFWIDQNTGKRIVIPSLEKLMTHFVKRSAKDRFTGWTTHKKSIDSVDAALSHGLGHLVKFDENGSATMKSKKELDLEISNGLKGAIEALVEQPASERGLKFTVIGKNGEGSNFTFSKSKKKKTKKPKRKVEEEESQFDAEEFRVGRNRRGQDSWWDEILKEERSKRGVEEDLETEIDAAKDVSESPPEGNERRRKGKSDADQWTFRKDETDKKKRFWKSVWLGKPRIKITGLASKTDLRILSEYLPHTVVERFRQLNSIIEMSKRGLFPAGVSNIVKAEYESETTGPYNKVSIREEGELKTRHFQPAEIYVSWEVEATDKPGIKNAKDLQMYVQVNDHDALLARVNYFLTENPSQTLGRKEAKRLFRTEDNLYRAAKDLLSRYSNSQHTEGGIAIFMANGTTGQRDAARMRTIVNGVIGFHPTKFMIRTKAYQSPWHELQIRKHSEDSGLPNVRKTFRVDRLGTLRTLDGEGFHYDDDNAYVRSQHNFSPSKRMRDHEGNPISKMEAGSLKDSVYRNKEGEILSVYSLNKWNSEPVLNKASAMNYLDKTLTNIVNAIDPRARAKAITSSSGWLHYTTNIADASLVSRGRMSTGYIDTKRHLDISSIPYNSDSQTYIRALSENMSKLTGKKVEEHLTEILNLRDLDGNKLSDLIENTEGVFNIPVENIESFLFTPDMARYFKKNDVHSLEYLNYNPISDTTSGAVAIWDNSRFLENTSRRAEANYFAYSPAKKREITPDGRLAPKSMLDILNTKISETVKANIAKGMNPQEAALEAFMAYKVSEDGETIIRNTHQITSSDIEKIISTEVARYEQILGSEIKKKDFFDEKGREEISRVLIPHMVKALRKQLPFASNSSLHEVARIALSGFEQGMLNPVKMKAKEVRAKGLVKTKNLLVVRSTILQRLRATQNLHVEGIKKSGIGSLAEIVEMSEGEWRVAEKVPEFLEALKKGKEASAQWIANNENLIHEIYGQHGGFEAFKRAQQSRQKDIFFLLDKALQSEMIDADGNIFSVLNMEKVNRLFADRTKQFVYQTLVHNNMSLMERKGLVKTYQKYRNIAQEKAELRSHFKAYDNAIVSLIKEEFHDRVMDVLTSLSLDPINSEIADMVRAAVYSDIKDGHYKSGSYDAIATSLKYYYELAPEFEKNRVLMLRESLNKRIIESLDEMEKSGFAGVHFVKRGTPKQYNDVTGKYGPTPHRVQLISSERGVWHTFEAENVWDWDGSHFVVVETTKDVDNTELLYKKKIVKKDGRDVETSVPRSVLKLIDTRTGREALTQIIERGEGEVRDAEIKHFLNEATARIHREVPPTILSNFFGEVNGPIKDFIIQNHLFAQGAKPEFISQGIFDFREFTLYKNGQYFVLARTGATKDDLPIQAKINRLKEQLTNGVVVTEVKKGKKVVKTSRKATLEELADMRKRLTSEQEKLLIDKGVVLELDEFGYLHTVKELGSLSEQQVALSKLKAGKVEPLALKEYINQLYRDLIKIEKKREEQEQKQIDRVLSKEGVGNVAKIKVLAKELQKVQAEWADAIDSTVKRLTKEYGRPVTALEAVRQIERDFDSARKNAENYQKRIWAVESQLYVLGAYSAEFSKLNKRQQEEFIARNDDASQYEWSFNPLDGTSQLVKSQWVAERLPRLQNESDLQYAVRLKQQLLPELRNKFYEFSTKEQMYADLMQRRTDVIADVEDKLTFLMKQLAAAQGRTLSKFDAKSLLVRKLNDNTGEKEVVLNIGKIKEISSKGKVTKPKYIPDSEGIVDGKPELFETKEELRQLFTRAILNVSDNWQGFSKSKVEELNTILSERLTLQGRKGFTEPLPVKDKNETPRQFEERMAIWKRMKEAHNSNWLSILGSFHTDWYVERKPDGSPKTGLPVKKIKQRSPKDVNLRINELIKQYNTESGLFLREILKQARREKNNTEFEFNSHFESVVDDTTKLTIREQIWVRDPMNKDRLVELQDSLSRGEITEEQVIQQIKQEAFLTTFGHEGFQIHESDMQLELVRKKIIDTLNKIDSINFGRYREKYDPNFVFDEQQAKSSIKKATEELAQLRIEEDALNTRIDAIISGAERAVAKSKKDKLQAERKREESRLTSQEDLVAQYEEVYKTDNKTVGTQFRKDMLREKAELQKIKDRIKDLDYQIGRLPDVVEADAVPDRVSLYSSPEFASMVERVRQKRLIDASLELERVRRHKDRVELAKKWATEYQSLIEMFRGDAQKLGFNDPSIVVSPNNPRTRLLYNAFATQTFDLYGTAHPLDWSGTEGQYTFGRTEKGEQVVQFHGAGDPARLYSYDEQGTKRPVHTVADYMWFARNIAEWHMAHPDAPMSAEDYVLVNTLVPKDVYDPNVKIDSVNLHKLRERQRIAHGILDNISLPENREKLIRAFVRDGLDLVMGGLSLRIEAYKSIYGLTEEQWMAKIQGKSEQEVEALLRDKEVVENALYWVSDGFVSASKETQKTVMMTSKTGKQVPIRTLEYPISTIIRLNGFEAILDKEMSARKLGTVFDELPYAKVVYESLNAPDRAMLDADAMKQLALQNDASILEHQAEVVRQRGEKPLWFADKMSETKYTSPSLDTQALESHRIFKLVSELGATEISIQKYKDRVLNFTRKRPRARDNMLSVKDDGLAFSNLTWDTTDIVSGPDSIRESNDGRYIIRRRVGERVGEKFEVYYIGESLKNPDGTLIYEIPTSRIGTFENTTDAQVMVRMFEDDVHRIKVAGELIRGGETDWSPLKVANHLLQKEGKSSILVSAYDATAFSNAVLMLYQNNGGDPAVVTRVRQLLTPLGDFGELQRVRWERNGKVHTKQLVISPTREGILSKFFDRTVSATDGMVLWIEKPKVSKENPSKEVQTATTDTTTPPETANNSTSNPNVIPESRNEQVLADATEFTVVQNVKKNGQDTQEWQMIKNRLGYSMLRMTNEMNNRNVFRLFNPASLYLGEYYDEMEAVDAILELEFRNE